MDAIRHPIATITGDSGNVRRLATKLGCNLEDATLLYQLARRDGYASAYERVLGPRSLARELTPARSRRLRISGRGPAVRAPVPRPADRPTG
jgi:hypothetical protein